MSGIGKSAKRLDAFDKVRGRAKYPGDFNFSDELIMKILFAGVPHARIRSIDTSAAEALEGVVAVYTAKDVPLNEYGLGYQDQPVLCGPGSEKEGGDVVRFEGDQVAVVVAETEAIAKAALKLIKVDYELLPLIDSLEKATAEDAYVIHPGLESNVFHRNRIRLGSTEEAFKTCDVIVEGHYHTPVQEHAYLQPEAGVAFYDEEDRITVIVAGQWTHEDRKQIAHALKLEEEQVRVIYPAIGGAFGGREDMSVQIVLGLAVMRLREKGIHRPVKIVWSREESIIGHHKRHAYTMYAKWGADKEGRILAIETQVWANAGAYAYTSTKVLGNATLLATGPYEVPNVAVDAYAVYTNDIPGGAFRGFGGPQANFMVESQMDKLAEVLDMDPVELRWRNLFKEGSIISMGSVIPKGVSIREVVEKCALKAGWTRDEQGWKRPLAPESQDPDIKMGIGFACGYKNIGFSFGAKENCGATIILEGDKEIEKAHLYHAGAEVGQGAHTVFKQFACEALSLPDEKIEVHYSDTANTLPSGSVSASRMTFMAGNSIIGAAKLALEKWDEGNRPAIGSYVYRPPATTPMSPVDGSSYPNFAYGYVAEVAVVEVNTRTGKVDVKDFYCANDVGRAINPSLVDGQIEGGVLQMLGYVLLENFKTREGKTLSKNFATYLMPTIMDIPGRVIPLVLEYPDPVGPYGARGMGEMPCLPVAPAVCNAVYDAVGVRFDDFPLTNERVLRGLGKF